MCLITIDYHTSNYHLLQRDEETSDTSQENTKVDSVDSVVSLSKQLLLNNAARIRIRINLEIDLIASILFIIGICTRLYRLEEPRNIV